MAERERFPFPSDGIPVFTTEFTTKLAIAIISPLPILGKEISLPFGRGLYVMRHHHANILDISHSH
jgi:hypothetical protein